MASFSEPDETATTRKRYKEITKTDITKYKDITSKEILVFGIHLDMTQNEVRNIVDKSGQLFFKADPFNDNRLYLYDNENNALAYFIWSDSSNVKGLQEIIFYYGFSKYMVGASKNLLTMEVINKNSEIVKDFIGYPNYKEITLDLPSLGLKSFSYYYSEKKFKVNRNISDSGTSISFSIFLDE